MRERDKIHVDDVWAFFITAFAIAWGMHACSSSGESGVQERRYDPRDVTAPPSPCVGGEPAGSAEGLGPSKLSQGPSGRSVSSLDLPGAKAAAPVTDGGQMAPGLVHTDCDQLLDLYLRCGRRRDIARNGDEFM